MAAPLPPPPGSGAVPEPALPADRDRDRDRWVEIALRVPEVDVEAVADVLREVAPDGVAILPAIRVDEGGDFAYEELPEPATVSAAVPAPFDDDARARLERRLAALRLSAPLPLLAYRDVGAHDWAEEWKRFYTLQRIGRRLVVHPSWEPYDAAPGEAVVALDPGEAFGTGQHETTRLCLSALERHVRAGQEVLDVGCGSGVLSVAAVKLGARRARGIDVEPGAVRVTLENAQRNGVADAVEASAGSLGVDWPWPDTARGCADIVVANISSPVVVALMSELAAALRPGGLLIASGFIARNEPDVRRAAAAAGLTEVEREGEGDWCCLVAAAVAAPTPTSLEPR